MSDPTGASKVDEKGAVRLHFAAGDFITRFPAGEPFRLRLETPVERHWRARTEGDHIRAVHPGTALLFQDRFYEVVRSESGGEGFFFYYLAPWQDELLIRQVRELSPAASEAAALEEHRQVQRRKRGAWLLLATPLLGLLPERDQSRLEQEYGVNASFNSLISAILIGLPAAVITVLGIAYSFGGAMGASGEVVSPRSTVLAMYFLVESMLRLAVALSTGMPVGSLPVVLVAEIVRTLQRRGTKT